MSDSFNTLWSLVLEDIKAQVSNANFLTFFKNTTLLSTENGTAIISAPSSIVISILEKRFSDKIKESLKKHTEKEYVILFTPKGYTSSTQFTPTENSLFSTTSKPQTPLVGHLPRVRAEFTFVNFAVSPSTNELAFVSAQTVANNTGSSYNPFFIYGPVGVGKTHLMHAIANHVYQLHPDKKIIYITSEEFTNEVVDAIRTNDTAKMKKRFRSAFLLLIDDIQFIEGKKAVQEEIFHTFNSLIDQGSQIALSSDRPPHEIKNIMDRLASRFAGGLSVDIAPPDFELKTAILLKKAEKYHQSLPIEVAKLLADSAQDIRSLEGNLLRVISLATQRDQEINIELARIALGSIVEERKNTVYADDVIKEVCNFYKIKPTQLKGPKRDASLVKARQICMYLLKTELAMPYAEIGNVLGGRDHTTIIHGVGKIEKLVDSSHRIHEDILGITQILRG